MFKKIFYITKNRLGVYNKILASTPLDFLMVFEFLAVFLALAGYAYFLGIRK
jgi:hypothetical protein